MGRNLFDKSSLHILLSVAVLPAVLGTDSTLVATAVVALCVHLIFNRFEPRKPRVLFFLLLGVPGILGVNLRNHYDSLGEALLYIYSIHTVFLLLSVGLYRLSPLHPLASYPGPVILRLSNIRMAYISWGGKRHIYLTELHNKYGTHIRIGPNNISIVDIDAISPVLGTKGMPRGPLYLCTTPEGGSEHLLSTRNPHVHAQKRRYWNHAFTPTAVKDYDDLIGSRARQFLDYLSGQHGVVDLSAWIDYFTFDFMGDLAFGGGFEMMRDGGDRDKLLPVLKMSARAHNVLSPIPWMSNFLGFFPVGKDVERMTAFANERVDIRIRRGPTVRDIFYHIADEGDVVGQTPSRDELTQEASLAIIAGADTTSATMSNLFYFLLSNPPSFLRLREEVDATFSAHEEASDPTKLEAMPYLNACINETLRLLPSIPARVGRTPADGSGPTVVAGRVVPEGTNVLIPFYPLHRDHRYFSPFPDSFCPERWLDREQTQPRMGGPGRTTGTEFVTNRDAFIPFSVGPSNCVGKRLAYREMRMVAAMLIQRFDMAFGEGYNPQQWYLDLRDDVITSKGSLPVLLTPHRQAGVS